MFFIWKRNVHPKEKIEKGQCGGKKKMEKQNSSSIITATWRNNSKPPPYRTQTLNAGMRAYMQAFEFMHTGYTNVIAIVY